MNFTICHKDKCTGCSACKDICPKQCITMTPDDLDALHPVIDKEICINCGLCIKTCPNNFKLDFYSTQKVWAAWSKDDIVRRQSASGGVAYELYRYWLRNGGVAAGVVYESHNGCKFILIEKESDIPLTQNSKYTFSDTAGIFIKVKQKLIEGIQVLFIGVPCQVAALYSFLKKPYDNLTTVDIICHGMPPAEYLRQHVKNIERKKKSLTSHLSFRDPQYFTHTFTFTLRDLTGKAFYKKKVLSRDNYQLGYHKALIYRENCYSCNYAHRERIADLTIGDFSGLGRFAPLDFERLKVSCILQNTNKGAQLISKAAEFLTLHERPAQEAFDIERQLREPSIKHPQRKNFEKEYRKNKNFKQAADKALKLEKLRTIKKDVVIKCKRVAYNALVLMHIK